MELAQTKQKKLSSKTLFNRLYVAVEGAVDDWACYVGKNSDGVEQVRRYGDKISEVEARKLFPDFETLRWRP